MKTIPGAVEALAPKRGSSPGYRAAVSSSGPPSIAAFDAISAALPTTRPRVAKHRAAVAVVLREGDAGLEVLLMRRADRDGDPWSGHISCPGGFEDEGDDGPVEAARRETLEELGLDLGDAQVLGLLQDRPQSPWNWMAPFSVTPVVFGLVGDPTLSLEPKEVVSTRWVPLELVRDRSNHEGFWFHWRPGKRWPLKVPVRVWRVRHEDFVVWGLTFNVLRALCARMGP
jgi:8-oxo-dGTP pyrophosphatase MutT (NUDIX family)